MQPFTLAHAWTGEGDLTALRWCREVLRKHGVDFRDAQAQQADAVKMHGMPLWEAHAAGTGLCDLRTAARAAGWAQRVPRHVRRYMTRGDAWFGIPVGVHMSNCMWLNASCARDTSLPPLDKAEDIGPWLRAARSRARAPLAVGAEPWQLGVLFESLVLAYGGRFLYGKVFEAIDGHGWHQAHLARAVRAFLSLREFVADEALQLDWRAQLERVRTGEACMIIMGDWVRTNARGLLGRGVPGAAEAITIADFFVPLAGADPCVAHCVACALTEPAVQRRFASLKGCAPALQKAGTLIPPAPSLALEQSCAQEPRAQLLAAATQHFLRASTERECIDALAAVQPAKDIAPRG